MAHLQHYDKTGTARFVTFSCTGRQSLLISRSQIATVLQEIEAARHRYRFELLGYVIMPNHVHMVLHPSENTRIGAVIGDIKKRSGYRIIAQWKADGGAMLGRLPSFTRPKPKLALWQPKCYDHNCRTRESVRDKIIYCHNNPVQAGLVDEPGDWEWSSYRWYEGVKSGIVRITGLHFI